LEIDNTEAVMSSTATKMKNHPAADAFPMMDDGRYAELLADIRQNGQREPITICEGMILDGRNRYRACVEAGVEPEFRQYEGDPWAFAWSLNGARRDLEDVRRALIKLECDKGSAKWAAKLAKIAEDGRRKKSEAAKGMPYAPKGETRKAEKVVDHNDPLPSKRHVAREARAAEAHVSSSTMARAEFIAKRPDIAKKVIHGEIRPAEAIRQIKRERIEKEAPAPTGKFRVIYADPPWSYGNTQPDYHTEQRDHYPVMPLSDICAMPVREWAEDNAVLFLWVTSPILEESFQVIKAWGFKYKASFVWDKVHHNMGHYNSVRHEFLLVCVRGSCQPDVRKLFDSVQSIERTEHSKKPDEFYGIIETIYTHGDRLEIFARRPRDGWKAYGNQS
jgi:N6-adenosine-specific RNA methylase IME4/ParB-like chromosome segregation protein Spo0J